MQLHSSNADCIIFYFVTLVFIGFCALVKVEAAYEMVSL